MAQLEDYDYFEEGYRTLAQTQCDECIKNGYAFIDYRNEQKVLCEEHYQEEDFEDAVAVFSLDDIDL